MLRKLLEWSRGFPWTRLSGEDSVGTGDPEAALEMVQQESDEPIRLVYLPIMLQAAGRK